MDDDVLARLCDAALPFVVNRHLQVFGLSESLEKQLKTWADMQTTVRCIVIVMQDRDNTLKLLGDWKGGFVCISEDDLQLDKDLDFKAVDHLVAFRDPVGASAEVTKNSLAEDEHWGLGRSARGVWLDKYDPAGSEPLGVIQVGFIQ